MLTGNWMHLYSNARPTLIAPVQSPEKERIVMPTLEHRPDLIVRSHSNHLLLRQERIPFGIIYSLTLTVEPPAARDGS